MADEDRWIIPHPTRTAASRTWKKTELFQLVLAETDVRSAVTVADHFMDLLAGGTGTIPSLISEAFLGYVAVCYARPFSHSRKSSVQSLPSKWGKFSDPTLQHAHNKMIDYRHTLFAHSDPSERTLLIVPDGGNFMGQLVKEGIGWAINDKTLKPESIIDFRNTAFNLKERLQERVSELIDDLYEGMDLPRAKFPVRFNDGL